MYHLDTLQDVLLNHWQFADISLLYDDPVGTLWYLHSQPPLLNAVTAALAAASVETTYDRFVTFNAVMSSISAIATFYLAKHVGLGRLPALLATLLFLFSPANLLNVAYPFYPSSSNAVITTSLAVMTTPRATLSTVTTSSLLMAALMMLRASFTFAHYALFSLVGLLLQPDRLRRAALLTIVLPLCVPVTWTAKNAIVFGQMTMSSWSSSNWAAVMVGEHRLREFFPSPSAIVSDYPELSSCSIAHESLSAFDKRSGHPNFNHCSYLVYPSIALRSVKGQFSPLQYLARVGNNAVTYLSPPSLYYYLQNRPRVEYYANAFDRLAFGTITIGATIQGRSIVRTIRLGLWTAILVGSLVLASDLWKQRRALVWPTHAVLVVGLFVLVHMLTHVSTNGAESQRFVFDVEGLIIVLFIWSAVLIASRLRAVFSFWRRGAPAPAAVGQLGAC